MVNLIMFHMISFLVSSKGLPRETCDLVFHVPYLLLESQRFVGMSVSAKRSFRVTSFVTARFLIGFLNSLRFLGCTYIGPTSNTRS